MWIQDRITRQLASATQSLANRVSRKYLPESIRHMSHDEVMALLPEPPLPGTLNEALIQRLNQLQEAFEARLKKPDIKRNPSLAEHVTNTWQALRTITLANQARKHDELRNYLYLVG